MFTSKFVPKKSAKAHGNEGIVDSTPWTAKPNQPLCGQVQHSFTLQMLPCVQPVHRKWHTVRRKYWSIFSSTSWKKWWTTWYSWLISSHLPFDKSAGLLSKYGWLWHLWPTLKGWPWQIKIPNFAFLLKPLKVRPCLWLRQSDLFTFQQNWKVSVSSGWFLDGHCCGGFAVFQNLDSNQNFAAFCIHQIDKFWCSNMTKWFIMECAR